MTLPLGAEAPDFEPQTSIVAGSVSDEQGNAMFGEWKSPRPYIRIAPQPKGSGR